MKTTAARNNWSLSVQHYVPEHSLTGDQSGPRSNGGHLEPTRIGS